MMMSTAEGLHFRVFTVASVMAFASSRFCSMVRPSKSWMLMVGISVPVMLGVGKIRFGNLRAIIYDALLEGFSKRQEGV